MCKGFVAAQIVGFGKRMLRSYQRVGSFANALGYGAAYGRFMVQRLDERVVGFESHCDDHPT